MPNIATQPTSGAARREVGGSGLDECIDNCMECTSVCVQTMTHCLKKGGKHAVAGHVLMLSNCADICQTSARFMLSGSPLHVHICRACAEVCSACADDCGRLADDEEMRRCVEACRRCALSCRQMAAH